MTNDTSGFMEQVEELEVIWRKLVKEREEPSHEYPQNLLLSFQEFPLIQVQPSAQLYRGSS